MARIRTIKPEFFANEGLSSLPIEAHLLAAGLLCYADDEGYFNANPGLIKAAIFPLRETSLSIQQILTELSRIGFIRIGRTSDGKSIGFIICFGIHQRVNRPTPSSLKTQAQFTEDSLSAHGRKGKERKGREQGKEASSRNSDGAESATQPAFVIPLTAGNSHEVSEADIALWQEGYPAVDVRAELRKVLPWLDSHPEKRSATVNGSKQRIVNWLNRAQDRGGTNGNGAHRQNSTESRWDERKRRILEEAGGEAEDPLTRPC